MKLLYTTFFYIFFTTCLFAQEEKDSIDLDFEQLDELTTKLMYGDKFFLDSAKLYEYINIDKSYLPQYTDEEFKKQMSLIPTSIPLVYNQEIGTLIKYFVFKRREYVTRMLTHAQYYFPKFEERLDSRNMPMELKVLPIVESALNANAKSRVGATGLWQIMHSTAQTLDLNVNTLVDERSDPDLSTEAALTYLTKLYVLYNDWLLALAAYNSGPGRVNRAIREAGGVYDFWRIRRFLPRETKNYVPSFIAMVYVMHYHKNFLLNPAKVKIDLHEVSNQKVYDQVSLKYIAELIGEEEEMLKYLNPSLKKAIVPKSEEGFELKIPLSKESVFLSKLSYLAGDPYINKSFYADNSTENYSNVSGDDENLLESPNYKIIKKKKIHKVRKNENLQTIARHYNATVGELRKWNKLSKREKIRAGQKLNVYVDVKIALAKPPSTPVNTAADATNENTEVASNNNNETAQDEPAEATTINEASRSTNSYKIHKIKKGENLFSIADKYHCNIQDLKEWNNMHSSKIMVGQKLKIYSGSATTGEKVNKSAVSSSTIEETSKSNKLSEPTYFYHIIKSGETLYSIARKYNNITVNDLYKLNHFDKDTKLSIGDKVKVPIF